MMFKFDKKLVCTALDLDKLEVGDIVAVADSVKGMKEHPIIAVLDEIERSEESVYCFHTNEGYFALAQLVAKHATYEKGGLR